MSDTLTGEQLGGHELEFTAVPEISRRDMGAFFEDVLARRDDREMGSYGAVVVRNGGYTAERAGRQFLRSTQGDNLRIKRVPIHRDALSLHTDPIRGRMPDLSVHHTTAGKAESIILVGSRLLHYLNFTPNNPKDIADAARLLDDGILPERVTVPSLALRTTVSAGDVLLFDASQPHIFRSITNKRTSRSSYVVRRQKVVGW